MTDFVASRLAGLNTQQCWDVHAHLLGVGDSDSGIQVQRGSGLGRARQALREKIFKHFTRSVDAPTDCSYLDYFGRCAEQVFPGFKSCAFAFTSYHDDQGVARPELSDFIIPNTWSLEASKKYSSLLYVASVHPRSPDALEQLEAAKRDGAVAIKWLPCAHNINPGDKAFIGFYEKLSQLNLPLITHAGSEHAVHGEQFDQTLGNPLHLRLPLECKVKVIVAHCATDGWDIDLDGSGEKLPSYELFARMMDEKAHEGYLYADISATPQINRSQWLPRLLMRQDWHHRLLNGSDYPLPAIPVLFSLRWLALKGLITETEVWQLNTLRSQNPLLFDFMLKRSLCYKGHRFSKEVFETRRIFEPVPQ